MRARWGGWLFTALCVIAAGCLGYLTASHPVVADWSAGARASLPPQVRVLLEKMHGPVQIVSYASPGGNKRSYIATVIGRYRQVKPDLSLKFVDPLKDPAEMRSLGITSDGEMIIHYRGHKQQIPLSPSLESDLSNMFERLARGGERIVAFVTGDGERNPSGRGNTDLGAFVGQLEQRGVRAVPLNFAQVPSVPQNTDLVVLASPASTLAPGAVKALVDYLQVGGNLLWLTDPGSGEQGLQPLSQALSVQVLPGMLFDEQGAALKDGSYPRTVAVGLYPAQAITRGFQMATQFQQVAALAQVSSAQWAVASFLRSSAQSWNERQPIDAAHPSTIQFDAASGDLKGPLNFGFALTRLSPDPQKNQQRAVVIGDGDFLSNAFLGNGGNRALGERIFDWLLGDDALINMPARGAPDPILRLSQGAFNAITGVFLIALPLLLLIFGLGLAWRRRRR